MSRQRNTESWKPTLNDFTFLQVNDGYTAVPDSNPTNHFFEPVLVGYSYEREFQGMRLSNDQEQDNIDLSVVLSRSAQDKAGWNWEVGYGYGREAGTSTILADSTGAFGLEGYERLRPVLDGLNVLGDATSQAIVDNNRRLLESMVERFDSDFGSRQHTVDGLVHRFLFALPGGPAQLAVGMQWRREELQREDIFTLTRNDSERESQALFFELGLPLLKDAAWAKELSLTVAARHDRFDQSGSSVMRSSAYGLGGESLVDVGGFDMRARTGVRPGEEPYAYGDRIDLSRSFNATSPLARLAWRPFEDLRLRATWGKSFLTPYASQQFGYLLVSDATMNLLMSGVQLPDGVDTVLSLTGPNPDLEAQEATSRTLGFDWTPGFATGLRLSATWNDTDFDNYIGSPLAGISSAWIFDNIGIMPPGTFTTGQNGVMLWDNRNINYLGRKSRTVDVNASWYRPTAIGDWLLEFNAVRTLDLSVRTVPGQPEVVFSDTEFGPSKWVGDAALSWEKGDWRVGVAGHYSGAHRVIAPLSGRATIYNDYTPNPDPQTRSGSHVTWDLQVGWQPQVTEGWLSGLQAQLGVQNLFDADMPFVDTLHGFVSNRFNVRGRVMYLGLKKQF